MSENQYICAEKSSAWERLCFGQLHFRYCGLFKVTRKLSSASYQSEFSAPMKNRELLNKLLVRFLKPFIAGESNRVSPPPVPLQLENGGEEYVVEKISNHCWCRGQLQLLLKWKGHNSHKNSWKSKTNFQPCQGLLNDHRSRVYLQTEGTFAYCTVWSAWMSLECCVLVLSYVLSLMDYLARFMRTVQYDKY